MPPFTIQPKQQQFALIVITLYTSFAYNNCSIELYNRNLQTTIILFIRNMSSHKTDWILSKFPLLAWACFLYHMVRRIMNALEGEYLCLRKISINKHVAYSVVLACLFVYPYFFILRFVVACLLLNPLFLYRCCCCVFTSLVPFCTLMLLLYFVY